MFMGKIISKSHNAFIQGRQILYIIFILPMSALDSRIKSMEPTVLCKLDFKRHMLMSIGIFCCTCRGVDLGGNGAHG